MVLCGDGNRALWLCVGPLCGTGSQRRGPCLLCGGRQLVITAEEGLDIRYTTDGSRPTAESTPYTGPIHASGTYRAVAVRDGWTSPMATITFAGDSLFTDFTSDDWYFEHVDRTVELGLFSGNGDQTFTPTSTITRASLRQPWPTWPV